MSTTISGRLDENQDLDESAQRGAQFTPDGMLKFVLKATAADEVLRALRTVLGIHTERHVRSTAFGPGSPQNIKSQ